MTHLENFRISRASRGGDVIFPPLPAGEETEMNYNQQKALEEYEALRRHWFYDGCAAVAILILGTLLVAIAACILIGVFP
jgi:hypothetical protein